MDTRKKNIMIIMQLKKNVFFKISHDLEENPGISVIRDHILRGSFGTRRKLCFNEQGLLSGMEPITLQKPTNMMIGSRP